MRMKAVLRELDRRDFLRGFAAAGVGAFTSACVSFARREDEPCIPRHGSRERVSLAMHTLPVGVKEPFSVLHISDTHLTAAYGYEREWTEFAAERTACFGGRQEEALKASLAWAREHVEAVIHTGDLIDFQSEANFDLARRYFAAADGWLTGATGNHEYHFLPREKGVAPGEAYFAQGRARLRDVVPFDATFHATVVRGVNFVCMEHVYGCVSERQARLFWDEAAKGLPIVLCQHVPFFTDEIWRAARKFWYGRGRRFDGGTLPAPTGSDSVSGAYRLQREDPVTREFIARLRREPLLKAILAGHLHFDVSERFSSTAVQLVAGANFMGHGQEILFT